MTCMFDKPHSSNVHNYLLPFVNLFYLFIYSFIKLIYLYSPKWGMVSGDKNEAWIGVHEVLVHAHIDTQLKTMGMQALFIIYK